MPVTFWQAQTSAEQKLVYEAFQSLPASDKDVLSEEMALTGIAGETYEGTSGNAHGPAFLLYYSPAFVRATAHEDVGIALRMLAEVYRCARHLYPKSAAAADKTVTVHMAAMKASTIKELSDETYSGGSAWLLVRTSDSEAVVETRRMMQLVSECA